MTAVTVAPMKTGAIASDGLPTLQPSVRAKIMVTSRNVPRASASIADPMLTPMPLAAKPGFGKYSPNIIAVRTDSPLPRTI